MSFNTKMTAINNEIRDLSGATGPLGLDAMASNLSKVNDEVNNQAELIAQIQIALQNKASGSEPVLQTKTVTPSTSAQNVTPDSGYDGLSKVTVNAIPNTYVEPTATKSATTYTPTTSNQTIAAGTYCSGAQTIKGDANLVAENIAEGVSIFGVTGTHSGGSSGGGGSIETYSGKISYMLLPSDFNVTYTDSNLNHTTVTINSPTNINIVKDTIVVISGGSSSAISGCTKLGGGYGCFAYLVTANNFEIQLT